MTRSAEETSAASPPRPPGACPVDLRGERLVALPARALWWPSRAMLIVADMHLGKGETYRALGVPVPAGIVDESLERLAGAVAATGSKRVIVLGDLIHARAGLTPAVRTRCAKSIDGLGAALLLVRGNHDRGVADLPREWRIEVVDGPLDEPPFALMHEPAAVSGRYALAGHLHPTIALDSLRLPCFHFGPRIGVLPAFSPFTRGIPMAAEAGDEVLVVAEGEVLPISGVPEDG